MSCHTVETGYKNIPVIRTFILLPTMFLYPVSTVLMIWFGEQFGIIGIHLI